MIRAKYINYQAFDDKLIAVYDYNTPLTELNEIALQLARLPGIYAEASIGKINILDGLITAFVWMNIGADANAREAVIKMKELTQPEVDCTIGQLTMTLMQCSCRYISSRTHVQFVDGLEPEDQESFWINYYTRVGTLSMASLITDPRLPFGQLMATLENLLFRMGVHASEIRIQTERDPRPCTHP